MEHQLTSIPSPIRSIGIISDPGKAAAAAMAAELSRYLASRGIVARGENDLASGVSADLLIVLGGDGAILRAARHVPGIPILGVNFGQIGFLAVAEQAEWRRAIDRVLAGDCLLRDEPTVDVFHVQDGEAESRSLGWFMNDVVVRSRGPLLHVEVYLAHKFLNVYPGDGLIVATPLGSSAYNMAANGPIVLDGVPALALTPICCHSPLKVSLVAPLSAAIDLVVVRGNEGVLWIDGVETTSLQVGDTIAIRQRDHRVELITFSESSYLDAFASKFEYQIRRGWRPSRS